MIGKRAGAATAMVGITCAALALFPGGGIAAKKKPKPQGKPNIVLVMTDDQPAEQQKFLTKTNDLLGKGGVTFKNSFVSYPLCCPSRATYLTGQYAHNHDIRGNQAPSGGFGKLVPSAGNTLPVWLQKAGYRTAHVGKFLNGYGSATVDSYVPPGWTEWYGALDNPDGFTGGTYTMYGYTLNENGSIVHYGTNPQTVDPATYQTDVYSAKGADFIRRNARSNKPFFLSVATLASHTEGQMATTQDNNPRAAPRHEGSLAGIVPPSKPSYNETDVSDKPQAIRNLDPMTPQQQNQTRNAYRARAESLLAVDDLVDNLAKTLAAQGELKNTVFIYTADNGFFNGEHRVRNGKVRVYEESIRVPLLMRGPGIPKDKVRSQPVGNIDLAPTITDIAGAKPQRRYDGRSLVPLAEDKLFSPGRAIGIEAFFNSADDEDPETPPTNYQAVRTDRYVYAEYGTGEQELYDLYTDPYQLQSLHANAASAPVKAALDRLLARTANCAGSACAARPGLKLKLAGVGGGCVASGIPAKLTGPDAGQVLQARFYANGKKAGKDGKAPFAGKVGAGQVSSKRKNLVTANVTLLDGRVATIQAKAPAGC